jgi:formate dehydrogenase accessory protein FdhE
MFYAGLAAFQAGLFEGAPRERQADSTSDFRLALDRAPYHAGVSDLLHWLTRHAPRPLAGSAEPLTDTIHAAWDRMLSEYWAAADQDPSEPRAAAADVNAFVVEAWLQPLATALAAVWPRNSCGAPGRAAGAVDRCPVCACRPVVALLSEVGHGARRSLLCGLCNTEWPAMRVSCPACGEAHAETLSVFRADEYPSTRVDACRACRTYVKTLDLTRDNTAVPGADDLASLPLDLWAREQGYTRLRPHLLRV